MHRSAKSWDSDYDWFLLRKRRPSTERYADLCESARLGGVGACRSNVSAYHGKKMHIRACLDEAADLAKQLQSESRTSCTVHQPNIEIFESLDELLLMRTGGQVIYCGPLRQNSHKIIEYVKAIPGVPKIKDKYNPATWMLEVSPIAVEHRLRIDFAEHYKKSDLYK